MLNKSRSEEESIFGENDQEFAHNGTFVLDVSLKVFESDFAVGENLSTRLS